MKLALGVILFSVAAPSFACWIAPPERLVSPQELIARTERIALAKVVRAEVFQDDDVLYTFKTIRALKGRPSGEFQIRGEPLIYEGQSRRFDDHMDQTFWAKLGGRFTIHPDCKIHPAFSVGGTYLVFLDQPYHVKSFEIIIRTSGDPAKRDKWLQYVESRTGP